MKILMTRIWIVLAALVLVVSCSEKKQKTTEELREELIIPKMTVDKSDSSAVLQLANQYMDLLKNKKVDEAIGMLYYLDSNDSIVPLPENLVERQKTILKTFPVLSYEFNGLIFNKETDTQVKYTIEFFEKEPGDNRPNTTAMFLKPVRQDGQWYLTVADSNSANGVPSEIKN